jgi:hypothetical protein
MADLSVSWLTQVPRYLDQLQNTWVSLKVFRSAMEHLGQPQGFLYQPWKAWVSLKVLGSVMELLGQPQGF